jgi:hypothetical protein
LRAIVPHRRLLQLTHREPRPKRKALESESLWPAGLPVNHAQHNNDVRTLIAKLLTEFQDLPARGDDVLDNRESPAFHRAALREAACPVGLGVLSHE